MKEEGTSVESCCAGRMATTTLCKKDYFDSLKVLERDFSIAEHMINEFINDTHIYYKNLKNFKTIFKHFVYFETSVYS